MNKLVLFSIAIIILILAASALVFLWQGKPEVTIGYSALRISLPVFVAVENGYFAEEGLNARLERFDTAQPLMNSLAAGSIQAGGYTALPITYSAMLRSKTELYFATSMIEDQNHRVSYLIVPKDSPKDFNISGLKGKKIGILPTLAYKVWLEEILKKNQILPSEVTIMQVDPALSPTALASRQVDALFTNDPAATTVIQKGIGRLLSSEVEVPKIFGEPFLFGSFNISKEFADKNPEITAKIVKALDRAVGFVNENPEASKQIMKKYLSEQQSQFVEFYPDALYQNSKSAFPFEFQEAADKYFGLGIIPERLSVEKLVISENFGK